MSHQKIYKVMSTDVATVREDTPFKDIVRILEQRDVSAVPVVDGDGHVVGVVSEADLLVRQGSQEPGRSRSPMSWWRRRRRDIRRTEATTAAELMTTPAATVAASASVVHAARELTHHNLKRLPVVGDDGKLVGIVSRKDLLTVFLRADEDIRHDIVHTVFELGLGIPVGPATVRVGVRDGRVTLDGEVELKSQRDLAEAMTRHTDGVVDVTTNVSCRRDDSHAHIPPAMGVDVTHEPWRPT